jgi:hypothetical protein
MKFYCKVDGIHFPQDFEMTLKAPCNFWGDMGMSNVSEPMKLKIWDWIFSAPSDELALKEKTGLSIGITGVALSEDKQFKSVVPGYEDMTEEQQQQFQRDYFKKAQESPDGSVPLASLLGNSPSKKGLKRND